MKFRYSCSSNAKSEGLVTGCSIALLFKLLPVFVIKKKTTEIAYIYLRGRGLMIELVKQIRRKDEQAITVLYNSYGKKLYGFAVSRWHLNEDEAWELVYKTLYKITEVIDQYSFETNSKFNGFIFRVFINNLKNNYQAKKSKQVHTIELEEKHGNILPVEKTDTGGQKESLHLKCLKAILAGFDDWKRVLLLMKAQDFSYEDIARYVQKPADQLKVYYMRAKQVLVEKINECVGNSTT